MAEFKLGRIRFVWKGAWQTGTTYYIDDVVRYGGSTYICTVGHSAAADFNTDLEYNPTRWNQMTAGQDWRGDWTGNTFYKLNDIVKYGGLLYICIDSHTSATLLKLTAGTSPENTTGLEADQAKWQLYAEGFDWKGDWAIFTRYKVNDLIKYGGYTYVCKIAHTSAATSTLGLEANSNAWDEFNGGFEYKGSWSGSFVKYRKNDVVKQGAGLWICTASHTSTASFIADSATYWSQFVEGFEFEDNWNVSTIYQPGDIVRYGGNQYVAKTNHVGTTPTTASNTDWDLFSEGFKFQSDWTNSTSYKIGEVVRINGYTYLAVKDSPANTYTVTTATASNDNFTIADTTGIVVGMTVRFTGTTFGNVFTTGRYYVKTVLGNAITISTTSGGTTFDIPTNASGSMTATVSAEPPNSTYWTRLNSGISWQGTWADDSEYRLGDAVRYGSNAYICILDHRSNSDDGSTVGVEGGGAVNSRPDQDVLGVYWNALTIGSETAVLTTRGDLAYYSGSGPSRLPVGTEGQILRSNGTDPEWVTLGKTDHVYYVAEHGTDSPAPINGLSLDKPWRSIRYACEQVENGCRKPNAAYLLEMNRAFIQREVTEWIDRQISTNTAPFTSAFDYDEYKCERDTGFVVDRLIWDINHGGNLKTLSAALAYINLLANGDIYATAEEGNGTGIYSKVGVEGTKDAAAYNYMLTLIGNVLNNTAPAVNYQTLNGDNSTSTVAQYINLSYTAEPTAITEITTLVGILTTALTEQTATNLPNRSVPANTIFVKSGTFTEVLPIIVPAETCILGDEVRSVHAGPIGGTVNPTDAKYSLATLDRLETIVGQIILGTDVTESSGNTAVQSRAWPYASSVEVAPLQKLIRTLKQNTAWRINSTDTVTITDPTGYNSSYLAGYGDARYLLQENKEFLRQEITAFIAVNYPTLKYSSTKCLRDVGYIVDAMVYDLTYGGYSQTLNAGLSYFDGNNSTTLMIDSAEIGATSAAYSRLKTVMQQIVANTTVTPSTGNVAIQFTDTTNRTGGSAASTFVGNGIDIIINIIAGDSTASTTPQINVTTIATNNTFTSATHGLLVGDAVIPRTTANGLIKDVKYWVVGTVATNTFQLAACYGGSVLATFTNGTGLDLDLEKIDYPTATNAVSSTTALITAAQTLDAAQETVVTAIVEALNPVAWHTDYVVDSTSLTTTDFRVYVGTSTIIHTYVSGGTVTKANGSTLSISGFSYNNVTGYAVITTATHGLVAGDVVDITNITVSCPSSGGTATTFVFPYATKTDGVTPKIRYKQVKCLRDVRLITEAVMFDFMFNSNFQTLKAAYSYLRSSASDVFVGGQKTITRNALTVAKTTAKANVGGDTTAQARIETLMTLVDDFLFGASNEGSVCQTEVRAADWARLQLERNRAYIIAEISAYMTQTFKGTVTASNTTTDIFTISDTSWMKRNAAVRFSGTVFGGVSTGTTYYVQNVVSATTFTIATTRNATTPLNLSTVASGSMTVSYYFDTTLCLRDVGRMIDAFKFDTMYPGNYKTLMCARYYANAVVGSYEEDMFYLRNGTGLRNMTLEGLDGDLTPTNAYGTRRTTAGAYASLDPGWGPADFRGWITNRSPYVQNCVCFGYAAIGQKIDGALHNGGNKSIVSNDFTQLISDGIGAYVTNNGRAELVSVFTYYAHIGYLSEAGGRIRGTNGNNSYGTFGSVAEGYDVTETVGQGVVDNRNFVAATGKVNTDGGTSIFNVEFTNAGTDYTTATYSIAGAGVNASVEQGNEIRDGAVFQVRLLDYVDDSTSAPEADGNYGGYGYISNANTAQGGTTTQITIAATDGELSSAYIGMKVFLTGGTAAGQFGIVATYNSGTKIATVTKESTGAAGWDHIVPGTTITSPDASTTYVLEPRISFTAPSYSSTARTLATSQTYTDVVYSELHKTYLSVTGTTSGSGINAAFNVTRKGTKYNSVVLRTAGTGYARLDTITLAGTALGGAATTNNITITITAVNSTNGAIQAFEFVGKASGGNFVAISSGSRTINTSIDGTTWTERLLALPSTSNWTSLATGRLTAVETAGTFVIGRSYTIVNLGDTLWLTIGAVTATAGEIFVATGAGSGTGTATPNASVTVAVSSSTTVNAYSIDGGITWTAGGALTASGTWSAVAYGQGKWVAVRSGSTDCAYSINGGISWLAGGALPASTTWTSITYGAGKFVAIASGGTQAASSVDGGLTWVSRTLPATSNWIAVAHGNNRFVAVSNSSGTAAAYSLDGITWVASTVPSAQYTDVRYGQGVFLAVSQSTQAASSEDGVVWTSRTSSTAANGFSGVVFGNPNQSGSFVAVQRSTASTVASQFLLGATAKARAYVSQQKIFAIRLTEPGSGYTVAPTITITDPNNTYEAPTQVRIGNGALANPSFINRGTGYIAASIDLDTGDGYGDYYQSGQYIAVKRLTKYPVAGSNVVFAHLPNQTFKLVQVLTQLGSYPGSYSAFFQIAPNMKDYSPPEHEQSVTTRIRYSQVRLTGHDFLDIGSGNYDDTNYPGGIPVNTPTQANETVDSNGGRVFYTSTDQDGNFRVGELFTIEQSTGVATLNADAFNIAGLQELTLGNLSLGGGSATITEFSTDPFFTQNSDTVVPTQRAIKAYITSQIGGGGAALNVNSVTAGYIYIAGQQITTTTGGAIAMRATFDFKGGVRGYPVAWNYFLNK